jgi:hypothetical protein
MSVFATGEISFRVIDMHTFEVLETNVTFEFGH